MSEITGGEIIEFSGADNLKKEIEKLRTELSMLMLERDELLYVECRNLEMQYAILFGALEIEAYEEYCKTLRLKRKIELIQAKINRQEVIITIQIELVLNEEFAEYQAKFEEKVRDYENNVQRSKCKTLNEEDTKDLKKLYRKIVKALHPDLNPDVTKPQLELFQRAVEAYERGDIDTMRMIAAMVSDPEAVFPETNEIELLTQEKEKLLHLIKNVRDEIAAIKQNYPYKFRELLSDIEKIKAHKEELEETIRQCKEVNAALEKRIEEMLTGRVEE